MTAHRSDSMHLVPRTKFDTIREERRHERRRQLRLAVVAALNRPIINLAVAMTAFLVMSNGVHGLMVEGKNGDGLLVIAGFVGTVLGLARRLNFRPLSQPSSAWPGGRAAW